MSLREEIDRRLASNQVFYAHFVTQESMEYIRKETTDDIFKLVEKRIDSMIGVDNQTINRKRGTMEGRIAAQASKNALVLVKEMLK